MSRKRSKPRLRAVVISLLISAAALIVGTYAVEGIHFHSLVKRLFWPLLRLLFFIGIGLVIGQIIEATGWTRYLAAVAMPAFRYGHLGRHCSAVFTTAFFSGVAANAMLMEFYKEGAISRKQLFLANLLNQFPAYFLHLPTTFFIVIPLTGRAGAFYFLLTFAAALLRTILLLVYGHFKLEKPSDSAPLSDGNKARGLHKKTAGIWEGIRRRLPGRLTTIALYVIPIYIAVFMLNAMGFFETIQAALARFTSVTFIPLESLSLGDYQLCCGIHIRFRRRRRFDAGRYPHDQTNRSGPSHRQHHRLPDPRPASSTPALHGHLRTQNRPSAPALRARRPCRQPHFHRLCLLRPILKPRPSE